MRRCQLEMIREKYPRDQLFSGLGLLNQMRLCVTSHFDEFAELLLAELKLDWG
jgi:hypothetical protein